MPSSPSASIGTQVWYHARCEAYSTQGSYAFRQMTLMQFLLCRVLLSSEAGPAARIGLLQRPDFSLTVILLTTTLSISALNSALTTRN